MSYHNPSSQYAPRTHSRPLAGAPSGQGQHHEPLPLPHSSSQQTFTDADSYYGGALDDHLTGDAGNSSYHDGGYYGLAEGAQSSSRE